MNDTFGQPDRGKLLPVLLAFSATLHFILAPVSFSWIFGEEMLELPDQKSGRTTVSVQLVAFKPQNPRRMVFEAAEPLPTETNPIEFPPPPATAETEYQKQVEMKPDPVIHHSPDHDVDAPQTHVAAPPQTRAALDQSQPAVQLVQRLEPIRKTVDRQQRPRTEVKADIPETQNTVTASSQQSTGADVPPRLVSRVLPQYPRRLLLRRVEGSVRLLVRIGTDGRPRSIQVHRTSGYPEMDAAASKAVRRWRFTPAKRGNVPFEKSVIVPVDFKVRR